MRSLGSGLLLATACHVQGAPPAPTDLLTPGDRLAVEVWTAGELALPWRFVDTTLGRPCAPGPIGDAVACLPVARGAMEIGYTDADCGGVAVIDRGAAREGDAVTWDLGDQVIGVFRVGAVIDDGDILYSPCDGSGEGFSMGRGQRRRLTRIPDDELVHFALDAVQATEDLRVDVLRADDGAIAVGEVHHGGESCWPVDGRCVAIGRVVHPFQRAFQDAACTEAGYWPQGDCDPSRGVTLAANECGQLSLLGQARGSNAAPGYRRDPGGACVPDAEVRHAGGDGGEEGVEGGLGGWFGVCLVPLDPPDVDALPALRIEAVDGDGLTQVTTFAGDVPIATALRLADGLPCAPTVTPDGVTRCVAGGYVAPATEPGGGAGGYVSYEDCAADRPQGPPLYTFFDGAPCAHLAPITAGTPQDEPPRAARVDRFVPWTGGAWYRGFEAGYPVCEPLTTDGWWVPEPLDPATLPALTLITR